MRAAAAVDICLQGPFGGATGRNVATRNQPPGRSNWLSLPFGDIDGESTAALQPRRLA